MTNFVFTNMIFFYFFLLLNIQLGSTASIPNGEDHLPLANGFCETFNDFLTEWKSCSLLQSNNIQSKRYHKIICYNVTEETLQLSLEVYAQHNCKEPLRLYIPELKFNPHPDIFMSVSGQLVALMIKSWNPVEPSESHGVQIIDVEKHYNLEGTTTSTLQIIENRTRKNR